MAVSREGTKEPLDEGDRREWKADLKFNIQKTKIMASGPITSWQMDGEKVEMVTDFIFLGSKINMDGDCSHEIKRCLLLGRKAMTNLDSLLKSRHITLPTKVHITKAIIFPVVTCGCELDHKEGWVLKNWCLQIVVLEYTLEIPLDCKEIKLVNPEGNQSWILTGRTDVETEALILGPLDAKSQLVGKGPYAAKNGKPKEKVVADEIIR